MIISQGAEAKIRLDKGNIIKERFSKAYRYSHLDKSLRQFRTRREAKILQRLEEMNFPAPRLREFCDQRMSIVMDFIPGEQLRDVLERGDDYQQLAWDLGNKIAQLHTKHIVHGDLTTSNVLVHQGEMQFIDFGLSQFSEKVEDKAVDLHLLKRALESRHHQVYPNIFERVLQGYREGNPVADEVLERFQEVQRRGRNKGKD